MTKADSSGHSLNIRDRTLYKSETNMIDLGQPDSKGCVFCDDPNFWTHFLIYFYRSMPTVIQVDNFVSIRTIGVLGFDSRRGLGIFLFTTLSRTALGPTQPPSPWLPAALSLGVKRPGREADNSPPSSAEVNMRGAIPPLPNTSSCRGA
jgi:hypothetical protein